ncbi:MAG: DNA translocase FtsK [bacterium]|nr:DNA translocase FtsK [bacterium]
MSKRDKKKNIDRIHPETKNSILAVILVGVAILLLLASFHKAGPVGEFVYMILEKLFGWGYYLLPTISLLVAGTFLLARQKIFLANSIIGASLFIISGLGLMDILLDGKGGMAGKLVGFLQVPFGYTASIILAFVLLVTSILVTFNASIKFWRVGKEEQNKSAEPEADEEIDEVKIADMPDAPKTKKEAADEDEEESEKDEEEMESRVVGASVATAAAKKASLKIKEYGNYVPPPASLLKSSVEKPTSGDLRANANIIKRTLDSFGIPVEMGEINIGPKVTRYTLKPAEGVKITKILALSSDLSLALAAHPIRIEAPIPGKSLVGIEVPNKSAAIVRLGSLISYPEFKESGPLAFVVGRGVSGEPIMADIEKMPHLLIAGATGSGKSVGIHALIISLLYKNSPATLRLAMVDPKRVELSVYGGLPHLIAPVVVEGKKSVGLFRWAIKEMENRYEILLNAGARDIRSYNQKNSPPLPYLVMIIDELADLMASYGKEIEGSIVRLAQMARATGIHLVVATQRPSVEVVTGLIKANITSRMALQVGSQVDSRTILDMAGAEKLLGGGDMLFISSEFSKPKRIQGAYVSEEEIKAVAQFIEENNELADMTADIPEGKIMPMKNEPIDFLDGMDDDDGTDDELYQEALRVVTEAQKASASLLQRRLKVGYARAARLLDIMEDKGVIGPGDGAKPREVYNDAPAAPSASGTPEDPNSLV